MKITQNLHTHTVYCDGKNTVDEMAQAAIDARLSSLGFSGHAFTPIDTSYCMKLEDYGKYAAEIDVCRKKYADRLEIFTGIEQDYYAVDPTVSTDFLIGSVHYIIKNGETVPIDETREITDSAVSRLYGGDVYAYLEDYFSLVSGVYNKTSCDIVGHIDLCEKFNADGSLFDRNDPRYISAYKKAVERLVKCGCIFEINTGAMSRGYTDFPYPRGDILRYIGKCGGRITISSDSHSVDTVAYKFDEMVSFAKKCGFDEVYRLVSPHTFEAVKV